MSEDFLEQGSSNANEMYFGKKQQDFADEYGMGAEKKTINDNSQVGLINRVDVMLFIDMRKTGGGGWEENRQMRGNYVLRPKWRNQKNIHLYKFEDKMRDKDCLLDINSRSYGTGQITQRGKVDKKEGLSQDQTLADTYILTFLSLYIIRF